jgi:phage terminase small subunit
VTEDKPKKLTKAQEVFIDEYLVLLNATEAYSRAYPKAKRTSARANGHELLTNTDIKAEIERRFTERHMSAGEALALQADIARGHIGTFLTPLGHIDVDMAREAEGRIVKKIKQRTITKIGKGAKDDDTEIHETEIELYPADAAQERILKIQGKFVAKVDVTSNGETVKNVDHEGFDRAITSLAEAIRESISGENRKPNGKMEAPE